MQSVFKNINILSIILLAFALQLGPVVFGSSQAIAQTVIPPHVSAAETDCFRFRGTHPVTGRPRPHTGHDYGTPTGTQVQIPPGYIGTPTYTATGGAAGNMVVANYPDGIEIRYLHLEAGGYSSSPPTVSTGATGGVTGPHLHLRLAIGGTPVDPEEAWGLDLSDDWVRNCLITDAQARLASTSCLPRGTCRRGEDPPEVQPGLTPPPTGGGDPGNHPSDSSNGRPDAVPQTYSPPSQSGGPETDVGAGPGGPVLWDSSEYNVGQTLDNACDTEVYVLMRGKGAFEAQEDVVASQMIIHRPDSVLEYTCADQFMGYTAEAAGPIFSENQRWLDADLRYRLGTPGRIEINVGLDEMSLDQVLQETIITTIVSYVTQQFPTTFLGATDFNDANINTRIGGATYTCTSMATVWTAAKCENFAQVFEAPGGPFYSFNEMIPSDQDPRTQYSECGDTGLFEVDIQAMRNEELVNGLRPAALTGQNMNDFVDPTICDGLPPIPTGVSVVVTENYGQATENIIEYDEHFCSNPGCYYNFENETCER